MNPYPMQQTQVKTEVINAFMRGVYAWMTGGLLLTAVLAFATTSLPGLSDLVFIKEAGQIVGISPIVFVLLIAELGVVFYLSARIKNMQASTATTLFLVYAGLNGITLSPILLAYTAASVAKAFLVTAGMFGAMSAYGLLTKRDLTGMGSFLMMGLFGLIIAMVVNIFLGSSQMDFVISVLGVVIFAGLTAWDTQRFKTMGETMPGGADGGLVRKGSIMGALSLYLDFINLFLFLLRFMGASRD
jgi:FtsH-binding integral membrane protein